MTAVLPDFFCNFYNIYFWKKPKYKATNLSIVDNVLQTKTNCLEQTNAGHFANEVDWSLDLLVTSLCSGRSRLFKQCILEALVHENLKSL